MDNNYKGNSYKSKSELIEKKAEAVPEKKIEKVTTGIVKTKKKNGIKDVFISEDASNVKTYVIMDVLVPAVKKAIKDIVTNGIEMILYGESGRSSRGSSNASYVSYNRMSDSGPRSVQARASYSYDDIIFETRGEAEEVLSGMDDLIDRYKVVSVADLYDLAGLTGNYTDNKYGWTNLRNAEAVRVRDGYMLKLPKALPL